MHLTSVSETQGVIGQRKRSSSLMMYKAGGGHHVAGSRSLLEWQDHRREAVSTPVPARVCC